MKLVILCQVKELKSCQRYQNKPGTTEPDYLKPKIDYTRSTLKILDNEYGIEGEFALDKQLNFGQLLNMTLDTEEESIKAVTDLSAPPSPK